MTDITHLLQKLIKNFKNSSLIIIKGIIVIRHTQYLHFAQRI